MASTISALLLSLRWRTCSRLSLEHAHRALVVRIAHLVGVLHFRLGEKIDVVKTGRLAKLLQNIGASLYWRTGRGFVLALISAPCAPASFPGPIARRSVVLAYILRPVCFG